MKDEKQDKKREKKPDEELTGYASAHLVIKDAKSGKDIVNTRG